MMLKMSATVSETVERHAAFLAECGVESPRLQCELLLAEVLKMPRLNLYLEANRSLAPEVSNQVEGLVRRRANREPLQHILGTTSFCGLEIAVRRNVFVPRPETELLAERALEVLRGFRRTEPIRVLDFGTGTGCMPIFLAANFPAAEFFALDQSAAALDLARVNSSTHRVSDRIQFILGDSVAALPQQFRAHLVVSNPPYIPAGEIPQLEPEVRDFDPIAALDGGADGLDCYRQLADSLPGILAPQGCWLAEFGDGQADSLRDLLETRGWKVEQVWPDYSGAARMFHARPAAAPPRPTHG